MSLSKKLSWGFYLFKSRYLISDTYLIYIVYFLIVLVEAQVQFIQIKDIKAR